MFDVSILCTDPMHPVNGWIENWAVEVADRTVVRIFRDYHELRGGDFLFLVSCHQIIRKPVRDLFRYTLVLHASDLPHGRGMSPHIWRILEGADRLVLSLLNAEDELDSGDIWQQHEILLDGTELFDEINRKVFEAELALMSWAIDNCDYSAPRPQQGKASFYRRRTQEDSRIDIDQPLRANLDLLRVSDPDRYPAFFEYRGQRYRLRLEKI